MISLALVNERTFGKIVDMKLPDEQNRFVAPNVVSLAQAWLSYDVARPYAILCDGEPVGFLMLDWDEGERTVGVWRFMIAREQQRKGYGRAALEATLALIRATGKFDLVHLDYVPGNDAARALYFSLGFRENGDVEDGEIIMTLPLTDAPQVGMTTADADDWDDFAELIEDEQAAGTAIPGVFADEESLKAAIEEERVKRLTLMGETIGVALGDELLLAKEHLGRLAKVKERLARG